MSKGKIKAIYPPGNNGSKNGAGMIESFDAAGNLTGPPYVVFQTPDDCVAPLVEGDIVTYNEGSGNSAVGVVASNDSPLTGG